MAQTLIIKDGDFSTNALDHVIFNAVECTGITLDKNSLAIVTTGNTGNLVATVTPSDCTQAVHWTSSDENVASVSNGAVTAVGVGSATITATCGSYSASATVTVTEFMDKSILKRLSGMYVNDNNALSNSGSGLTTVMDSSTYANRGCLAASSGDLVINPEKGGGFYPYPLPKNTKRIKITDTGSSGIKKQLVLWYNLDTPAPSYNTYCAILGGTVFLSVSDNPYIVDVPTYTDLPVVDSLAVLFRTYKTGTTFVDADFNDVTIEFLPAE